MTNSPDQPASAPVRGRWRHARRLVVTVAAAGALVLVVHLPVVQRLLLPVLQEVLSATAGGAVTVGSLEFNLWTGRVHGTGLRLVRPGLEITGTSLEVHVRPWRGLVIRATEPRLVVSLAPEGTPAARDLRPWTALERVAAIDVVRGAIQVRGEEGSHALLIEGLDVSATREEGRLAATVGDQSGRLPASGVRRGRKRWMPASPWTCQAPPGRCTCVRRKPPWARRGSG